MELPTCENYERGQCRQSDVKFLAAHGPTQYTWYWTFQCKTCKLLFYKFNPEFVAAARAGKVDRELGSLAGQHKRFAGYETRAGKVPY